MNTFRSNLPSIVPLIYCKKEVHNTSMQKPLQKNENEIYSRLNFHEKMLCVHDTHFILVVIVDVLIITQQDNEQTG